MVSDESALVFSWTDDHPDLHSFPTRRSSDLHAIAGTATPRHESGCRSGPAMAAGRCRGGDSDNAASTLFAAGFTCSRSEEHTSELQSRRDLVCRLLLEKKKFL